MKYNILFNYIFDKELHQFSLLQDFFIQTSFFLQFGRLIGIKCLLSLSLSSLIIKNWDD